MSDRRTVLVALSGGVDSAVACASLKEAGYEVKAAFMRLGSPDLPGSESVKGHLSDVQRITDLLGVELHVLDYSWDIQQIIEYFIFEYSTGRTPNPCARCNAALKFGKLLAFARQMGARYLATGHYARIVDHEGHKRLARGRAGDKDQSYVLFGIRRADLGDLLFPNGEAPDKEFVRRRARQLSLPVHDKEDSQEICFVPEDDYVRFLTERGKDLDRPGPIVDVKGTVLGEHSGVFKYTIGQRRGLRIAAGEPLYVIKIDARLNTLVVGPREALARKELVAGEVNWHIDRPDGPVKVHAQIRSTHQASPARIERIGANRVKVQFDQAQYAITPGQAVVFYQDDMVAGGGWILDDA